MITIPEFWKSKIFWGFVATFFAGWAVAGYIYH